MKDQPIKLQLNSEAAIRSIIEGDPELQIEIKNKISCAIAHGYERIDQAVVTNSVDRLSQTVTEIVYNNLTEKVKDGCGYRVYLKPPIREMIDERVKSELNSLIYDAIGEARKELKVLIKERVDSIADEIVRQTVNDVFENSVRDEVIRRYDAIQKAIDNEIKNGNNK